MEPDRTSKPDNLWIDVKVCLDCFDWRNRKKYLLIKKYQYLRR